MLNLNGYWIEKNVHVYKQGGLNIAYDVNSGSLHLLDNKTYDFIKEMIDFQKNNPESIDIPDLVLSGTGKGLSAAEKEEVLAELGELQRENILFSEELEELVPKYPDKPIIKALCLHVAHDCNLRCKYCFAGTGPFGGSRALMDLETGKKAIDFLLEHSGHRDRCEVDFFGGEPLLNFGVVKELVSYGKKASVAAGKKIKFTLTTNAVLLDKEVSDFLEREDISVVLSFDGRREVHDRMRSYPGGRGSYDVIVAKILDFIKKRPDSSPYAVGKYYYVRGTYTRFNTDFYKDALHMADMGISRVSLEPVVACPEEDYALREEDLAGIKESYDILGEKILEYKKKGKEFTFFHFNAGLAEGPCLHKRLSGCGAGHEYVAVSPEGDIYPCHQFVGQENYKLASLHDTPVKLREEIVEAFRNAHIYSKQECRSCWARFSCSGGCHASNTAFSGELTRVYPLGCELQKKRLEVAYYLKIKEASSKYTA